MALLLSLHKNGKVRRASGNSQAAETHQTSCYGPYRGPGEFIVKFPETRAKGGCCAILIFGTLGVLGIVGFGEQ